MAELEVQLIDRFGALWYCDPDQYPIAVEDEQQRADERFDEVRADRDAFAAITDYLGLDPDASFTAHQRLRIYRLWKQLNAIDLSETDGDRYAFDLLFQVSAEDGGFRVRGTIDEGGTIHVDSRAAAQGPNCPICLSRGTLIETPRGPTPVESLAVGDGIWSVDASGRRVAARVTATGSMPAPRGHRIVHLRLADGREMWASPGHPLIGGRPLGTVRPGDLVDGARVVIADLVRYAGGATFDLRASGQTGGYWANGIPLASTLAAR